MLTEAQKKDYAKSFTEIALQEKLICTHASDNVESAKEIATFFNTLVANLGDDTEN